MDIAGILQGRDRSERMGSVRSAFAYSPSQLSDVRLRYSNLLETITKHPETGVLVKRCCATNEFGVWLPTVPTKLGLFDGQLINEFFSLTCSLNARICKFLRPERMILRFSACVMCCMEEQ